MWSYIHIDTALKEISHDLLITVSLPQARIRADDPFSRDLNISPFISYLWNVVHGVWLQAKLSRTRYFGIEFPRTHIESEKCSGSKFLVSLINLPVFESWTPILTLSRLIPQAARWSLPIISVFYICTRRAKQRQSDSQSTLHKDMSNDQEYQRRPHLPRKFPRKKMGFLLV